MSGQKNIGDACFWNWECANYACGRPLATDSKECCDTNEVCSFVGFDYCSGYDIGTACQHNCQCRSDSCTHDLCLCPSGKVKFGDFDICIVDAFYVAGDPPVLVVKWSSSDGRMDNAPVYLNNFKADDTIDVSPYVYASKLYLRKNESPDALIEVQASGKSGTSGKSLSFKVDTRYTRNIPEWANPFFDE